MMKLFTTILFTFISLVTFGQKDLTGFYSSHKADLGFFVTKIQLNSDSTFKYEFSGDLAYYKGTGLYWVESRKVIHLIFDEVRLDSANMLTEALSGGSKSNRPKKFLFSNGRLYPFHVTTNRPVRSNYLVKRIGKKLIFRGEQNTSR